MVENLEWWLSQKKKYGEVGNGVFSMMKLVKVHMITSIQDHPETTKMCIASFALLLSYLSDDQIRCHLYTQIGLFESLFQVLEHGEDTISYQLLWSIRKFLTVLYKIDSDFKGLVYLKSISRLLWPEEEFPKNMVFMP